MSERAYEIVPVFPDLKNAPVYLFGEAHTDQLCYDAELWMLRQSYSRGLRHLIYEVSYYAAAELNIWMKAADDTILNQLFQDWNGTLGSAPNHYAWFKSIKQHCPELVFHGVDIDPYFNTTGARHLARLEGQEDSDDFKNTTLAITFGQSWHAGGGGINYQREYFLFRTFERELVTLRKADPSIRIFGIFGRFHTDTTQPNNLISMLRKKFGEIFQIWKIKGPSSTEE